VSIDGSGLCRDDPAVVKQGVQCLALESERPVGVIFPVDLDGT